MTDPAAFKQVRVAIWGGCGFIGRHLVPALLKHHAEVSVVVRRRDAYVSIGWEDKVRWIEVGVSGSNPTVFREVAAGHSIIYNLSGTSGAVDSNHCPQASLESICRHQLEFLEACKAAPRAPHIVFASSRLVYGRARTLPVDESHPVEPLSMYAAHKLCVEHYHRIFAAAGALTYTICRISNPYGADVGNARKSYGVINNLIRQGLTCAPITVFGDGRQLRDYIHVSDLVHALLLCGMRPEARNELLNIGLGSGVSFCEAARMIQELTGATGIHFRPWPREYELVESGDYVSNTQKTRNTLGFYPKYDFRSGLEETVGAYRAMLVPLRHPLAVMKPAAVIC